MILFLQVPRCQRSCCSVGFANATCVSAGLSDLQLMVSQSYLGVVLAPLSFSGIILFLYIKDFLLYTKAHKEMSAYDCFAKPQVKGLDIKTSL